MAAAAREPRATRCAWRGWLIGGLAAGCGLLASAHPMPESRVLIDAAPNGATLTVQLPLNRLEFAYGRPLSDAPDDLLTREGDGLARYLLQHVGARSGNQGWLALRPRLAVRGTGPAAELEATIDLRAPTGADPRSFTLLYDAVTHEVRTHRGLVYLRNDWAAGHVGEPPRLLGEITPDHNALPVSLAQAEAGASVIGLFKHGARHIAEGTDHLLFLLTLLLVAPLTLAGRRWGPVRPPRQAVARLVGVVSAFTVGHSVTLALGSAGVVTPPEQAVEVAVAASIVVAAVHALRPLLGRGEVLMAAGFGLLHGLAFAASLSGAGLTVSQHMQALLAFNLGIEAMQLLVVACAVPPLLVLAHVAPRAHAALRVAAALAAAAAAGSWVVERLMPDTTGFAEWVDAVAGATPAAALALWAAAGAAWALSRRRPGASRRA